MHIPLEVAQTPETDATRNSFVIVVRCDGTDLADEIKVARLDFLGLIPPQFEY